MCDPCPPGTRLHYVQPPKPVSFKPVSSFKSPKVPIDSQTVYKRSFQGVDASTAAFCRPLPCKPDGKFRVSHQPIEKDTVAKLSYPGHFGVSKQRSIFPCRRSLLGKGPIQKVTTQKHDFVPKRICLTGLAKPPDADWRSHQAMESNTTMKLSFQQPANVTRTVSCKPESAYRPPLGPMDTRTTQKQSYMPVETKPRVIPLWAVKPEYRRPEVKMDDKTTQKTSYQLPGWFVCVPDGHECGDVVVCEDNYPKADCYHE